jgi:hypothetical protein
MTPLEKREGGRSCQKKKIVKRNLKKRLAEEEIQSLLYLNTWKQKKIKFLPYFFLDSGLRYIRRVILIIVQD